MHARPLGSCTDAGTWFEYLKGWHTCDGALALKDARGDAGAVASADVGLSVDAFSGDAASAPPPRAGNAGAEDEPRALLLRGDCMLPTALASR